MMKAYYLHQMGIQTWVRRDRNKFEPSHEIASSVIASVALSPGPSIFSESLDSPEKSISIGADVSSERLSPHDKLLLIAIENCVIDPQTRWLYGKTGSLLKNMLHSISLTENDVAIVSVDSSEDDLFNGRSLPIKVKPKAILFMGNRIWESKDDHLRGIPLISTLNPVDLLKNPIRKKDIFIHFARLYQLIFGGDKD